MLDEGIGAGDAAFIEKANRRLNEFVGGTGILVLASHSEALVRQFCNKYCVARAGKGCVDGGGIPCFGNRSFRSRLMAKTWKGKIVFERNDECCTVGTKNSGLSSDVLLIVAVGAVGDERR